MTAFRMGSQGDTVRRIQARLAELGCYGGPLDGRFGGGTAAAVKTFQVAQGIAADGIVGEQTWGRLFAAQPAAAPEDDLFAAPVEKRCLALTGGFETGSGFPDCFAGLSGDFDGQGISLGVAQWNLGQGSLQPLLHEALRDYPEVMADVFHEELPTLKAMLEDERAEQLAFARSIQHPVQHWLHEPWRGMFKALCRTRQFQDTQLRFVGNLFDNAKTLARQYGLHSQRGLALMFDIMVQNGGIAKATAARIRADVAGLDGSLDADGREVAVMRIVAERRAEAAKPEWMADVRARKLCIALGVGRVHGTDFDLAAQFNLGLGAWG